MDINLFDYDLPEELFAQAPIEKRDTCKLMGIYRAKKSPEHTFFPDIYDES